MPKMYDIGRKNNPVATAPGGKKEKNRIYYPTIHIEGAQIPPELKKIKTGDKFRFQAIGMLVGEGINTFDDREPRMEIEVRSIGYIAKDGKLTKKEFLSMDEKDRDEQNRKDLKLDEEKEEKE